MSKVEMGQRKVTSRLSEKQLQSLIAYLAYARPEVAEIHRTAARLIDLSIEILREKMDSPEQELTESGCG